MHDIWRVFRYLKFYPLNITANLIFNMLAVFFNLFTFVTIVPFVELLFGSSQPAEPLPPFAFVPDFVHVLYEGRIVKTGPKELALELEQKGYEWIKEELESGK